LMLVVDGALEDLRRRLHPARTLLRQAHDPAEAGEHDVRALLLGLFGDCEGNTCRGEDARDQDLLPLEDHRLTSSWRRLLNSSLSISLGENRWSRMNKPLS